MAKKNTAVNITTAIIAVIAAAAAIFAVVTINSPEAQPEPGFILTASQADELYAATDTLVRNNFTALCLYYTQGLPHKPEPYGNAPEDGVYTVNSDKYKTLEDVESIVDSVFIESEAERIKTDPTGNGPVYHDRGGELGIDMNFTPMPYNKSWENIEWHLSDVTESSVTIIITVGIPSGEGVNSALDHDSNYENQNITGRLLKINGQWKLESILY